MLSTRCQAPRARAGHGAPEHGAALPGAALPGAAAAAARPAAVRARPLRWLVPPEHEEWPVGCTGEKAALCDVVRRVAKRRQVRCEHHG